MVVKSQVVTVNTTPPKQILSYDDEADRYEKRIKELEFELEEAKEQLKQKNEELANFLKQF